METSDPESLAVIRAARRRTYLRDYMRKRRAKKGVRITALLTARLNDQARAAKPASYSWEQWWPHLIRRGLAVPKAAQPSPVQKAATLGRNSVCSCGSGR